MPAAFYGTLAAADLYFADRGNVAWAAVGENDRMAALVRGSQVVDGLYEPRFPGLRTGSYEQPLSWPRRAAVTANGEAIPNDVVPLPVTYAAYEVAVVELTDPGSLTPVVRAAQTVKREKVGPLETEYAAAGSLDDNIAAARPVLTMLDGLLYPFLRPVLPGILVV
ncbi:DnaT-like ssDNA-binding protein [Rhizobium rhizogenes]